MKKLILLLAAVVQALACYAMSPEEIVKDAYKLASESKFEKIASYILPDSISPLTRKEEKTFADFARMNAGDYTSFTVEDVTVNAEGNEAVFTVKTEFTDGRTFIEKGTLRKNANGRWRLMAGREESDIVDLYSVSAWGKMTPELMRNLHYAILLTLSDRGLPQYQHDAAGIYYNGFYLPEDSNKAFALLSAAADKGYIPAYEGLGVLYYLGDGVEKDYEKSLQYLQKGIDAGDIRCLWMKGKIYKADPDSPIYDPAKAKELLEEAAEAGCASAYHELSVIYLGDYGETDYKKGLEYLFKALDLKKYADNNGEIERLIGLCYYYGAGTDQNINEAIEWFNKSVELHNTTALTNLIDAYTAIDDYDKWLVCVEKLLANDDDRAYRLMYVAYYNGLGVQKDVPKAMEYLMKGAESENPQAMAQLARHYLNGADIPMDLDKAIEWAEKSANAGNYEGYSLLGNIYTEEPLQDFNKVYENFLKASQIGSPDGESEYNLGICYMLGNGTDKDITEAMKWFDKAAQLGYIEGLERIGDCYYEMEDYEKALQIFNQLVEQDNRYGEFMIGQCYELGHGVESDLKIAKEWYEKGWYKKYGPAMDAYRRLLLAE